MAGAGQVSVNVAGGAAACVTKLLRSRLHNDFSCSSILPGMRVISDLLVK